MEKSKEQALTLKNDGNKLFKEGKYEEANEKYTQAIKHDPANSVFFSNRSLTRVKLGYYEQALSDASECIKLNPQWSKGFYRKAVALEGLGRHAEVMQCACAGFRFSGENQVKRDFVACWLRSNQELNRLPSGSIDLPRGIVILSKDYLQVLAHIMRSLNGECPLSQEVTELCLYSCSEQMEKILVDFGEPVSPVIKEWAGHLPQEVYPYSVNPVAKVELEKKMKLRSESFTQFLDKEVDPAIYPLLRPILGLIVLVLLNRTNILTECNTGHHAAELMNRALFPLFEKSILSTDEYRSMYVGRICAVLDSFIGRGYALSAEEITSVRNFYSQVEKVIKSYPKSLPEFEKDKQLVQRTLSNVRNNILLPATPSPPAVPVVSTMSVELAEQLVKEKPQEVKAYIEKRVRDLQSVKFLTMGEVEELVTITGIFLELKMREDSLAIFRKGEQSFFQVLGHMLSLNTLMLDQCSATIAPMRQLVLCQARLLKENGLFADVVLRWKSLFTEFRSQLIQRNSGDIFRAFFLWYVKHKTSLNKASLEEESARAAVLQQMKEEEQLLQKLAKPSLEEISRTTCDLVQKEIPDDAVAIDYIFFAPLWENPLLDAYCVILMRDQSPLVCELNYKAIRNQSALVASLLVSQSSSISRERINFELGLLASVLFPQKLLDILASENITHLYISPDSDIAHIPFDSLPVKLRDSDAAVPLFEIVSVSILSSVRQLLRLQKAQEISPRSGEKNKTCSIIGNPNFDLCKPSSESSSVEKLITFLSEYFGISEPAKEHPQEPELKYSQEELDFVSSHLRSCGLTVKAMAGDKATLSEVLAVERPLLLHISSHAHSSTGRSISAYRGNFYDDLKSGAIALAGYNTFSRKQFEQLPPECGPCQLSPLGIYSMDLRGTKLVFLSACSSGAGTAPVQEAAGSLAEAFLTAGAETVIATLWPVRDQSAYIISKLFYKIVTSPGIRPSEALADTKKCLLMQDDGDQWSTLTAFVCYGLDKPLMV